MADLRKNILIVDDEAPIRRLSQRILKRKGYETKAVETGAEGLRHLDDPANPVDVVLLDLNLPDGSGKDWAVNYRVLRPELPIVYFTGSNAPAGSLDTTGGSGMYYLKKPFTPASIAEIMDLALQPTDSPQV